MQVVIHCRDHNLAATLGHAVGAWETELIVGDWLLVI